MSYEDNLMFIICYNDSIEAKRPIAVLFSGRIILVCEFSRRVFSGYSFLIYQRVLKH